MTSVSPIKSPILTNTINQRENHEAHREKVYQQLTKRANDVKPNEAKAKLVRQNPIQGAISSVSDVIKDGKNFFTAVKTGQLSDNNLGRINDLGMKIGAGLIATYLSFQAKTKTASIMNFLGGATFVSMMSLWPKLFINLPARLVHGFKIDQKYINAQGDKKDFFLDNQFLPWDVFSDNELREYARRSGIDYDSENGKEKIMRKMQKTALQNRTLWMATAGFATPLFTAVIGDAVEPHIKNAVVKHGAKKAIKEMKKLDETLAYAPSIIKNKKELEAIFAQYKDNLDDEGIKQITSQLNMNFSDVFKDPDDVQPIKGISLNIDPEQIKRVRRQTSIIEENIADFEKKLKDSFSNILASPKDDFADIFGDGAVISDNTSILKEKLTSEVFDGIIKEFKELPTEKQTTDNLAQIFVSKTGNDTKTIDEIHNLISNAKLNLNDSPFFTAIKDYNENVVGSIRGKLKAYADILNRIAGSKDESVFTQIYRKTLGKLFKSADFSKSELKQLQNSAIDTVDSDSIKILSKFYQRFVGLDENQYKEKLASLMALNNQDSAVIDGMVNAIVQNENLEKIGTLHGNADKKIYQELNASLADSIKNNIEQFINVAQTNIKSISARNLITAGLERFLASEGFEEQMRNKNLIPNLSQELKEVIFKTIEESKEPIESINIPQLSEKAFASFMNELKERFPNKQLPEMKMTVSEISLENWKNLARELVYEGTVAMDASRIELSKDNFNGLKEVIYNPANYKTEIAIMPEVEGLLKNLIGLGTNPKDNAVVAGISGLARSYAKEVLNNKNWKSIFIPATLVLVAVTLLAQPFFGNITKEFPENKKKEAE